MRFGSSVILVALMVGWPLMAEAATVVVELDEPILDLASHVEPPAAPKLDLPAKFLLLPLYEVNKLDPTAETTLFSVWNPGDLVSMLVDVFYFPVDSFNAQALTQHTLSVGETLSVNINDVADLEVDSDGVARGYVLVSSIVNRAVSEPGDEQKGFVLPPIRPGLAGDFFQVVQNEDFASGDRLKTRDAGSVRDLCQFFEARFLNGGAFSGGTDFVFFLENPRGSNTSTDPPSIVATVIDEAGVAHGTLNVYTDNVVLKMSAAEFTDIPFGTLDVSFNGSDGHMSATYNALGRFSVGMDAVCKDRFADSGGITITP